MANRRWLNDRKTMGFESSKKSVNIRVHDAFFLLFFYFFYQASASPPARRRDTALVPARPYPSRFSGVPFSCASRLRWLDASKSLEIVSNATEQPFCSIHHRFAGSLSCVQHASNPHKTPHKPTETDDSHVTRSRTNKHRKPLTNT